MKTKEQLREELRYIAVKVTSQEEQDAVAKVFDVPKKKKGKKQ
jgi:hypothetical protein